MARLAPWLRAPDADPTSGAPTGMTSSGRRADAATAARHPGSVGGPSVAGTTSEIVTTTHLTLAVQLPYLT